MEFDQESWVLFASGVQILTCTVNLSPLTSGAGMHGDMRIYMTKHAIAVVYTYDFEVC